MTEVKIYDDDTLAISLFKDAHLGVVVQMYRYMEQMIPNGNEMQTRRTKSPLFTSKVSVHQNNKLKPATAFKLDVKAALDDMYRKLQEIQNQDNIIDGVLNDYKSRERSR